jgi:hypothetical protein
VRERLFKRFVQADQSITRQFGGTGLGLSICAALAEMMGGRIDARRRAGPRGDASEVDLPLTRIRAVRGRGADDEEEISLEGLRVLVAEDHPTNRKVVEIILEPFEVDLTMVEDGQAALDAGQARGLRRHPDGHADAGHGRPDRHPPDPRARSRRRAPAGAAGHADRQRHGGARRPPRPPAPTSTWPSRCIRPNCWRPWRGRERLADSGDQRRGLLRRLDHHPPDVGDRLLLSARGRGEPETKATTANLRPSFSV